MKNRFERTTNLRRPRKKLWALVAFAPLVVAFCSCHLLLFAFLFVPCTLAALFLATRDGSTERVIASRAGLQVGGTFLPSGALENVLVRHDGARTFVSFGGTHRVDVEVRDEHDAVLLLRALELDAASTTIDIPLMTPVTGSAVLAFDILLVVALVVSRVGHLPSPNLKTALALAMFATPALYVFFMRRVTVRVGADGIAIHSPLRKTRFIAQGTILDVRRKRYRIVISTAHGDRAFVPREHLASLLHPDRVERKKDEAQAIVRRIKSARRASLQSAGAPALGGALDRGSRTAHEWIAELRRIGEGAAATFRTMSITRPQLLEIVASTTAGARDRIAAAVALRAQLTEDERPRIRVAAERCAQDDLRRAMIRVLDTEDDSELEELVDELSKTHR